MSLSKRANTFPSHSVYCNLPSICPIKYSITLRLLLPRNTLYVGKDHGPRRSPAFPHHPSRIAFSFTLTSHNPLTVIVEYAVHGVVHVRVAGLFVIKLALYGLYPTQLPRYKQTCPPSLILCNSRHSHVPDIDTR